PGGLRRSPIPAAPEFRPGKTHQTMDRPLASTGRPESIAQRLKLAYLFRGSAGSFAETDEARAGLLQAACGLHAHKLAELAGGTPPRLTPQVKPRTITQVPA